MQSSQTAQQMLEIPALDPEMHYLDVIKSPYYKNLIHLRHLIKMAIDHFFSQDMGAINIDLFMWTNSISSPMGSGSDSEPIEIQIGGHRSYLTDSAQFGFEPLVLSGVDRVYCYLPSMRGEDPDYRHLNQFYHCEYEGKGDLAHVQTMVGELLSSLAQSLLKTPQLIQLLCRDANSSLGLLNHLASNSSFQQIEFHDAIRLLEKQGKAGLFRLNDNGKDITAEGEIELCKILQATLPFWITGYDRDRTPFYHKPRAGMPDQVINADLICPPIIHNGFGGELVGSGQRQDKAEEIMESLDRQSINSENYRWYIDLRTHFNYQTTSGFGMGVERFIAWILGLNDITYANVYPRLKNKHFLP
jgi:aspartyl/asparaginyl-tRNA synthetase